MNEMTEAEWRKAEIRQPGKTYLEPEGDPNFRDPATRWAIASGVAALFVGIGAVWSALPLVPLVMDGWNDRTEQQQSVDVTADARAVYDAAVRGALPVMIPYTQEIDTLWTKRCEGLRRPGSDSRC